MKILILLCLFFLITCQPAHGAEEQTPKFNSFYLFEWVANCSQALHPMLMQQGYPERIAIQQSAIHCSCVIDEFRRNFTMLEVQNLSYVDRQSFSETYSRQCIKGKINL